MENKKRNLFIFIPTVIIMVAFTIGGILLIVKKATQEKTPEEIPVLQSASEILFERRLRAVAKNFGIPDNNWRSEIDLEERKRTITIRFPRGKLIEEFIAELFEATQNTEYKVVQAKHIRRGRTQGRREFVIMVFENKRRANEKIFCEIIITNEVSTRTASAAFLIKNLDKLSKENADALLAFPEQLNYILTPWQTRIDTTQIDTNATVRTRTSVIDSTPSIFGKLLSPVLIEIPIEERETNEPETHFAKRRYTIMQSDDRRRVNAKIKTAVNFYPKAVGIYSRTGNLVLNSREISKNFLQALGRRNLAFFDARHPRFGKNGVCREVAEELGVYYDTISISIPLNPRRNLSESEWELELKNAIERAARSRNSVILIAADNNFVPVFVRNLSYIQRKGIEFVPITNFSQGE